MHSNIIYLKNYEGILERHHIYVYPRISEGQRENHFDNHPKIHKISAPIVELSSTFIRQNIKEGKNIVPMLPKEVWEYVEHNLFLVYVSYLLS